MIPRYERYEELSWDLWEQTLTGHRSKTFLEDCGTYLPSPMEIEERKNMLLWLQLKGFSDRMIKSVMWFDHPGMELVMRLEAKYGARRTERRLRPFLLTEKEMRRG